MLVAFEVFSVKSRNQNVTSKCKKEKKKSDQLREENPLFIGCETSFSILTRGLEWDAGKMLISTM